MNFDEENDYEGFLIKTTPLNSQSVKDRIVHFGGSVLSDVSGNGYVVASMPLQYVERFKEYFKRSEAKVYNIEGD